MLQDSMYSIVVEDQDVVVRLNRKAIGQEALTKFLDYLELTTLSKKSELTNEQAAVLADEVDQAVWETIKPSFEGE